MQQYPQDDQANTGSGQNVPPPQQQTPLGAPQAANADAAPNPNEWITFASVRGLPIVDLANGSRLGDVSDLILSPTFRYIEAFTSGGGAFRRDRTFPARSATIGLHAITLPRGALENWDVRGLDEMPRASALLGMKLLTETGRIAGVIHEIRLDPSSGNVLAFEVLQPDHNILDRLRRRGVQPFPTSAVTQYGRDAVIIQEALARQYLGDAQ